MTTTRLASKNGKMIERIQKLWTLACSVPFVLPAVTNLRMVCALCVKALSSKFVMKSGSILDLCLYCPLTSSNYFIPIS